MSCRPALDLDTVRKTLGAARGPQFWRSLEELAGREDFRALLAHEFPRQAAAPTDWSDDVSRRRFLQLMAASLALAGLQGCAQAPQEEIVPYTRAPESAAAGQSRYFATAMPLAGYAVGLLVESREGRPIKIEGNPQHPANLPPVDSTAPDRFGPSDRYAQASLLGLYDPDRSQTVTYLGDISSLEAFGAVLRERTDGHEATVRLRILTETVTSPTLAGQLDSILRRFPRARWHVHEPTQTGNAAAGARQAFGQPLQVRYRLELPDVILSLDCDFLGEGATQVRHMRDFSSRRRVRRGSDVRMNRLYVAESMPTVTGTRADHRWPLRPSQIESLARAVADELGVAHGPAGTGPAHGLPAEWVRILARDLSEHRGRSLIIVGESQPPFVHALVHALNSALGNLGQTVELTTPVAVARADRMGTLAELADDLDAEQVDILLIVGGNPAYSAPADLRFAERMMSAPFRAHLSLYADETSDRCHWHLPEAHYLESWGDARGPDGTVSLVQPLIAPLYGGISACEFLAPLTDRSERNGHDIVRSYWRGQNPSGDLESWWRKALHDGLVADSAELARPVTLRTNWAAGPRPESGSAGGLEVVFRPDAGTFDGRFANNGWLQELPRPITTLTWDNAVHLSPATAVRLGLAPAERPERANGQMAELTLRGRRVNAPLLVLAGHADDCVTLHLGQGRTRAGRVGTGRGFDAYTLRTSTAPWFDTGLEIRLLGRSYPLAFTQHHHLMENRDLVRAGTVQQPPRIPGGDHTPRRTISLYPEPERPAAEQWGMVIDLTLCTGCSACIVACQSENNIPVVGKDEVARGREMHWLRVDSYFKGEPERPQTLEVYTQPVPCMHCENAPCEVVCPVAATAHSSDGLNDMVYNRCVGTRYCSNNCPYKVRRFNFFQYADFETESYRLMRNPEVTVRSRGVMEKCTYCVQHIRAGQIQAQRENRPVRDGEVLTACQAVCPAGAIVFGNLNDRQSQVARLQEEPLNYGLLADLNTRPRTTYLAAIRNPHPELARLEGRS